MEGRIGQRRGAIEKARITAGGSGGGGGDGKEERRGGAGRA
jgi:hypothetical protein